MNRNSLSHPKVQTILADAFYWLRTTDKMYDAIFIDFPYPKNYNLARLYSIEFYRHVLSHLKKDGFAVLDAPLSEKEMNLLIWMVLECILHPILMMMMSKVIRS